MLQHARGMVGKHEVTDINALVDECLGLLDCAIHPHLDYPAFPDNAMAKLEALAATLPVPSYLIDDQTGLLVQDGAIQVVSEGNWKLVQPSSAVKIEDR